MNKFLIIFAHPSHAGHNGYFLEQIKKHLTSAQADFEILDLYALNYDPLLKSKELYGVKDKQITTETLTMQEKIKEANRILFIYPTWWQNMPAILKGFFDHVFVSGFAFVYKNGLPVALLKNKKAAVFTSTGGPEIYTRLFTGSNSLRNTTRHILKFCGLKTKGFLLCNAKDLEKNKTKIEKISNKVWQYLKD